jgi:uncharacterized membrane protein
MAVTGNTTYFIGRALYQNGERFLISIFLSKPEVVQPINKILLAGFYLVNIGFVLLFFSQDIVLSDWLSCLEFLSMKIGMVYLVLGSMHLFNILLFMTIENKFNTHSK